MAVEVDHLPETTVDETMAPEERLAQYLGAVLGGRTAGAEEAVGREIHEFGAGDIGPEYWADAPWRLEPGLDTIPFTFIIRDGEGEDHRVRLKRITIFEATGARSGPGDRGWQEVAAFEDELGPIEQKYWVYRPGTDGSVEVARAKFTTAVPGQVMLLKVVFEGSRKWPIIGRRRLEVEQYLRIYVAAASLPLRDTSQWYYGDTHYHSSYTNDIKEFGNPVAETREAGRRIGLDWVTITDHSVDIADNNPYWENPRSETRWDDLGLEADAASDDHFRVVRGEEVTLLGRPGDKDDTLHLLVYGDRFDKMIPGAFAKKSLLAAVTAGLTGFGRDMYEHLFGPVHELGAVLTGIDRAGNVVEALKGRTVGEQGAIAFAAHPTFLAQLPGGVWEVEDLLQPIHGMEAWNARTRFRTGQEANPFDNWKPGPEWEESRNKSGIDLWDQMLRHKVGLADPRFVLLGGSDAHGSFNYSVGWWADWNGIRADDNCLGKVRTLIFLPHRDPNDGRKAPSVAEVVGAFAAGRCVVTDGPVVNLGVRAGGQTAALGDVVDADGDIEVVIQAASTDEFGPVQDVNVHYFFQQMDGTVAHRIPFAVGESVVIADNVPDSPGYIRLSTETTDGDDTFRCFTNPIWLKPGAAGSRQLRATCVAW